jgi:polyhydroxyalkanoate synthesis regulator phasin
MLEEIRKGLLSGLGAIFLTKDKIENVVHKMVDEAKISRDDAQKLRDDLLATGEKEWAELEESFLAAIKKGLKNLDLCRRSEFEELKDRVAELEKRISAE